MTKARIYCPDKTAMQSGKAKDGWVLEFEPAAPLFVDNLMGWTGMSDTTRQIRLNFSSLEEATGYASRQNIPYEVALPHKRSQVAKTYADNFQFNKPKF